MAEITSGEWKGFISDDGSFQIEDAYGAVLCQRSPWPSRAEESAANGYLFCAAPDLLAALNRVLNHPLIRITGDVEILIREAIDKAEGQSNG